MIVNPVAGGGRAGRLLDWLRARLELHPGGRLEVTRAPGDATRWAAASDGRHDRVIAVGGDGTVQEIVNGLLAAGGAAALGVLPVGSGNDLARSLGLPREPERALAAATGSRQVPLDVVSARGATGERWFVSAGGIGFDAQVAHAMAHRRGWQRGRAGYLLTALAELRRIPNREVRLVLDDAEAIERRVLLVAFANGAFYGGGMRIAPEARVDDGILDVCIVGDVSRATALRQIPNLYRGTHVDHPAVEMRRAARVAIEGEPATPVHLDGEPFGRLPLVVEVHPGRLRVAAPAP